MQSALPPLPEIKDPRILSAVFTHPNYTQAHISTKVDSTYDRLEILGDAYIELFAIRLLFTRFPQMPAGRLSQQRELLIKNETLAEYALAYGFDKRALVPKGLFDSIGSPLNQATQNPRNQHDPKFHHGRPPKRKRDAYGNGTNSSPSQSITAAEKARTKALGDIFEAYIAGLVMSPPSSENTNNSSDYNKHNTTTPIATSTIPSTGFHVAETFLHTLWTSTKLTPQRPRETLSAPSADAKVRLAQKLLSKGIKLEYREEAPPDESQRAQGKRWFYVGVFLTGWGFEDERLGGASGLSKKEAGLRAAMEAMDVEVADVAGERKKEFDRTAREERERVQAALEMGGDDEDG